MSQHIAIPSWVPHGVRSLYEVSELSNGNKVAERILTDPRMEQAWKDLKRVPEPADIKRRIAGIRPFLSPEAYVERSLGLTDFDRQSAALFYLTIIEVQQKQRVYWTRGEADRLAEPYLKSAKLCNDELSDPAVWGRDDLLDALKLVGEHFQEQARVRQMHDNPRVLRRRRPGVPDEKRGHSRMIAVMVRDLFSPPDGSFPHSAVARLVAASLGLSDAVDDLKESVRDWCEDLPPEKDSRFG